MEAKKIIEILQNYENKGGSTKLKLLTFNEYILV